MALTPPPIGVVRLHDLRVRRATGDVQIAEQDPAAGDQGVQLGGLAAHGGVGPVAAQHRRDRAHAVHLLERHDVEEQVARHLDALGHERVGDRERRGDTALHVAGAPPVELAVAELRVPGARGPLLHRVSRDRVEVAVEQERPAAARAGQARPHDRPTVEGLVRAVHRVAAELVQLRLEQLHLGAELAEVAGDEVLVRPIPARRIVVLADRRVVRDHLAQDRHDLAGGALVDPLHRAAHAASPLCDEQCEWRLSDAGTSSAGLRWKKPSGFSMNPMRSTGITGQSSGRGRWLAPNVYQTTTSRFSTGRSCSTQAASPVSSRVWFG